jgi:hypothetical protein
VKVQWIINAWIESSTASLLFRAKSELRRIMPEPQDEERKIIFYAVSHLPLTRAFRKLYGTPKEQSKPSNDLPNAQTHTKTTI